ncbi:hypothetical protein PSTG_08430 [Puccinia striiformis f. sp. tritici PST-78]|uniref:Transcription factor domain-containing protein n=2 Tax=Puccinia striiformis f. sp. tritici TaxID=168172 RepID=A0A0L0VH74_9BASI|nr:hypothetical protein PSTG_08430 [Puccinia striiformis f. sp. tritici PST-78]
MSQHYYQPRQFLDDGRRDTQVEDGCSINAIGRRVERLIRTLEPQSFPSEVSRCRTVSQDKWEALYQVESGAKSSSEDGMIGRNFHRFLVSDCRQFLNSEAQCTFKSLEAKIGIWQENDGPRNLPTLLARIPNLNQAKRCLKSYQQSCGWIHRLLPPSFCAKVSQMLARKHRLSYCNRPDLHWLAVLFAACGLGLWAGEIPVEQDHDIELPRTKLGQRRLALIWLRCASSALVLGQYEQDPSLDSLRAMSLLLSAPLFVFKDNPTMEGAMELIMQTINLARHLNLDVDPDYLPYCRLQSEMEKDERRRFMIAILCQEFQLGGLFCKKSFFELPSRFTLKMPQKFHDEEDWYNEAPSSIEDDDLLCQSPTEACSPTHGLDGVVARYKVGQVWQSIGSSFSEHAGPPAHGRVLDLDQQLLNVEKEFPSTLKTMFEPHHCVLEPLTRRGTIADMDRLSTHIVLASAHIRLHRPFVIPREGISIAHQEWHRSRILFYGRLILTVNESDHLPLLKHVSMSLVVLAASIALSVLLITPTGQEEDLTSLRQQVYKVYRTYQETTFHTSLIWNRGFKLLGLLLETDKNIILNPERKINFEMLETLLQ